MRKSMDCSRWPVMRPFLSLSAGSTSGSRARACLLERLQDMCNVSGLCFAYALRTQSARSGDTGESSGFSGQYLGGLTGWRGERADSTAMVMRKRKQ
jgi:hypothetical protein